MQRADAFFPRFSWRSLVMLLALVALTATAFPDDAYARKKKRAAPYRPPYSHIVVDARTGKVLEGEDSRASRHPASLTKMMTLYMTFRELAAGRLQLDQPLKISSFAAAQSPSKLGLRAGSTISAREAVLGLVTQSANDAAVVLAEAIGGSEKNFASQMTAQARRLGMDRTVFRNASGLPDKQQVTTARDMAILGRALLYHYPAYYPLFSTKSFTYKGVTHANHNHLMKRYDGMDGIKTGFIRDSGFNLVASAQRNDKRLIAVVFGGRSTHTRDSQMEKLLDRNFARFGLDEDYAVRVAGTTNGAEAFPVPPRKPGENGYAIAEGDTAGGMEEFSYDSSEESGEGGVTTVAMNAPPSWENAAREAAMQERAVMQPDARPEAAALPPSVGGPVDTTRWAVQVGAYSSREQSQLAVADAARAAKPIAGEVRAYVQEVKTADGPLYRARLTGLDKDMAGAICGYMVRNARNCITVPPEQ